MSRYLLLILLSYIVCSDSVSAESVIQTKQVYTYENFKCDLQKLKTKYPDELEIKTIGSSHFNRDIDAIRLGHGKKNVLLIGSHHGREWITTLLLMKMLETYTEASHTDKDYGSFTTDIFDRVSLWFVPLLNPDGVTLQQSGLRQFPFKYRNLLVHMNKGSYDFKRWKANGLGIDLNRQYPAGWDALEGERARSYQFYKGTTPFQAKETIAIANFTDELNPAIAIAYHTAGREIFWKFNNGLLMDRDRKLARKVSKLTGYKLGHPPDTSQGGGFTDWFITTFHKPAMTIEISFLVGETNPPISVFNEEWDRNQFVGIMLVHEADKLP